MPYRKIVFTNGDYYHVLNRGVDKRNIFSDVNDYRRFLSALEFYRFNPEIKFSEFNRYADDSKKRYLEGVKIKGTLASIISYSLMPNHFHIILKQMQDGGIQTYLRNLQNSYAKYFNARHKRSGVLFQSVFRAVHIEDDEQLLHVSRYIHLNPVTSGLINIENLDRYEWNSYKDFCNKRPSIIEKEIITDLIQPDEYSKFVVEQATFQKELDQIKKNLE